MEGASFGGRRLCLGDECKRPGVAAKLLYRLVLERERPSVFCSMWSGRVFLEGTDALDSSRGFL